MPVETVRFSVQTRGGSEVRDLSREVADALRRTRLRTGLVTVFVVGSTAGITTMEFEPGLVTDLRETLERLVPERGPYEHNRHDDNGHAHLRAALVGPSVTVPFAHGSPLLGTWQQIVLVDFDTRARRREIICQLIGE